MGKFWNATSLGTPAEQGCVAAASDPDRVPGGSGVQEAQAGRAPPPRARPADLGPSAQRQTPCLGRPLEDACSRLPRTRRSSEVAFSAYVGKGWHRGGKCRGLCALTWFPGSRIPLGLQGRAHRATSTAKDPGGLPGVGVLRRLPTAVAKQIVPPVPQAEGISRG